MQRHYPSRIGTFLMLTGLGLLVLFFGTVFSGALDLRYLVAAAAALFIGSRFRRTAPRPEPSRFSSLRKMHQRSRQRRTRNQPDPNEIVDENEQINSPR
jgi:hypothetical protein